MYVTPLKIPASVVSVDFSRNQAIAETSGWHSLPGAPLPSLCCRSYFGLCQQRFEEDVDRGRRLFHTEGTRLSLSHKTHKKKK
jgi:hypothetical protein